MMSGQLRSCCSPTRLAHDGDIQSSQWRKSPKFYRAPFEWITESLLYGAVASRNLHVPVNSVVVRLCIKRAPWAICFLIVVLRRLERFYEPQCGWVSLNISILHNSVLKLKVTAEVLNSTCRTVQFVTQFYRRLWSLMVCELDSLKFFPALVSSTNQIIWSILTKNSDWLTLACFRRV